MRWFFLLILAGFAIGLGFDDYTDVHPVSCSGITIFEDEGTYLRDVYVDSSSVTGDGTQENPYQNLEQAAANAQPGDIIHMAAGTYPGGLSTTIQGTAQHPIQVRGEGEVVINAGSNCWQCVSCEYLVVRNIKCINGNQNGFNFDDGGTYIQPAHHILFDNIEIRNIGTGGNNDHLKISGLDNFIIKNSTFRDSAGGGSCIDMVGCHDGLIINNDFQNCGSNFVQAKGGTRNITIHGNYMDGVVHRAVNMGGSTGPQYFRPPISSGIDYEAKHIRVTSNIIKDVNSAAAYVGCDHCLFANNIVYMPRTWVARILQETTSADGVEFIRSRNGEFVNNIIYFRSSDVSTFVNVGSNTMPETFRFANNLWYAVDNPSSGPNLPTTEINGFIGNPMFIDAANDNFHLQPDSPAIGNGEDGWVNTDFDRTCFDQPQIGAYTTGDCAPTELSDLVQIIDSWKTGSTNIQNLMQTIQRWKDGC